MLLCYYTISSPPSAALQGNLLHALRPFQKKVLGRKTSFSSKISSFLKYIQHKILTVLGLQSVCLFLKTVNKKVYKFIYYKFCMTTGLME